MHRKSFHTQIFDLSFSDLNLARLAKLLYLILLPVIVLSTLSGAYFAIRAMFATSLIQEFFQGLLLLLSWLVLGLLLLAYARVASETILLFLRVEKHTGEIAQLLRTSAWGAGAAQEAARASRPTSPDR